MKLYLFGGAETSLNQVDPLLKLMNRVILDIKPKQLLHVPFARLEVPKGEEKYWGEGWLRAKMDLNGIELLDARKKKDLAQAEKPAIFINGGPDHKGLLNAIKSDKRLYELVMNAEHLTGESAGSLVVAQYQHHFEGDKMEMIEGLGILKDTIIEPHYTERDRHQLLIEEMKQVNAKYGIGIDCITGISFELNEFPHKYTKIGKGLVEIKTLS